MRRNLLLSAATVLIFFGLLETGLRLSGRVPTDQLRSPDLRTLDSIPGLFEPGQDFIDRVRPDLSFRVRINSQGFRGGEFPLTKRPGSVRVLCIGDSYTFGPYVEDDQTFPARLERSLKERAGEDAAIEVINGGASGFTIDDELIFFRDKAGAVDPDIVVLVFCQNDIMDLSRAHPMIETMRDHARLKSTFVLGPVLKLLQRTAIFNGMQRAAAMVQVGRMHAAQRGAAETGTARQWRRYRESLGQFVDLVRRRGSRLLLVVWISADQVFGRASMEPQEKLAGFAKELGVEAVDLASSIRELQASGVNPYFVPIDGHPNARAYDVAARETARRLVDLGYLAPPASR